LFQVKKLLKFLKKAGWKPERQQGSHIILTKAGNPAILSIPDHKEIRRGTLRGLIRNAGLTVAEFVALLQG